MGAQNDLWSHLKTQGFNFRDDAEAAEAGVGDRTCLPVHHPS